MPSLGFFHGEKLEQLCKMRRARKLGINDIASHFGVSRNVVIDALVKAGQYERAGIGRKSSRKPVTVTHINPYSGTLKLSNGEVIPSILGYWKIGDVWTNGL